MLVHFHLLAVLTLVETVIYQSQIKFSGYSFEFDPADSVELISTHCEHSLSRCARACNEEPRCRTCDYDSNSCRCRLFEGELSTGQLIPSTATSRVASITYHPGLFTRYNKSCAYCMTDRYLLCLNDLCSCPQNTYWDGEICVNQKYAGASCNNDFECRSTELPLSCVQADVCSNTGNMHVKTIIFDQIVKPNKRKVI